MFSESKIRQKYREAYQAFSVRYPKVQFAWSYKTNYLDAVCQIFHQEGSIAEVVSDMEYEMAKRLGVNGTNIIYNGPHKTKAALERAFLEGARVHLDHHDELRLVEQIAKEQNRTLDVGLRINMDTGIYPK